MQHSFAVRTFFSIQSEPLSRIYWVDQGGSRSTFNLRYSIQWLVSPENFLLAIRSWSQRTGHPRSGKTATSAKVLFSCPRKFVIPANFCHSRERLSFPPRRESTFVDAGFPPARERRLVRNGFPPARERRDNTTRCHGCHCRTERTCLHLANATAVNEN